MSRFKTNTSLAYIAKRPRFLFLDGVTVLPVLFIMVKPSLITLGLLLTVSLSLYLLEQRGIPVPVFMRMIRSLFVGRQRYFRPPWRH